MYIHIQDSKARCASPSNLVPSATTGSQSKGIKTRSILHGGAVCVSYEYTPLAQDSKARCASPSNLVPSTTIGTQSENIKRRSI